MALSKDEFAAKVRKALRARGHESEYDPDTFALRLTDSHVVFLGNFYDEYRAAGWLQRRRVMRVLLDTTLSPTTDFPVTYAEAAPNLLPRVRAKTYYPIVALQIDLQGMQTPLPPIRDVDGELVFELCYDTELSVATVNDDNLETWGVSFDEAFRDACANLRARSEERMVELAPGLYGSPWNDYHDASRLALVDVIHHIRVQGDHLAMVPHRDALLVCGSEDVGAMSKMLDLAAPRLQQARAVSAAAMVLAPGGWKRYQPPDDHPLAERFHELYMNALASDYNQQKELLDALHDRDGVDVFVASVQGIRLPDGRISSYAMWADGVDTLLPRTDLVAFKSERFEGTFAPPWEAVVELVGHRMVSTDLYPTRWRVSEFPSEAELDALRRSSKIS